MKELSFIIDVYTNLPDDACATYSDMQKKVDRAISGYGKSPAVDLNTGKNGQVHISFKTDEVNVDECTGTMYFYATLQCNDDVSETGIDDTIFNWVDQELKAFMDYIRSQHLKIDLAEEDVKRLDSYWLEKLESENYELVLTTDFDTTDYEFLDRYVYLSDRIENYKN